MAIILRNLSILWSLAHCIILFLLLFDSRYPRKKTSIIIACTVIPLVAVFMSSLFFFGLEKAAQLLLITCIIPSFILFLILAKNRDARFVFTFGLVDTVIYDVIVLTNILDYALGVPCNIVMFVSRLLIYPVLEFIALKYLRKPYISLQRNIKKGWGIFASLTVAFYILLLVATLYPTIMTSRPEYYPVICMFALIIPIMYITVFRILSIQMKLHQSTSEMQILDMQVKLANERLIADTENENKLKTFRHDLRHRIILLNDYIKNGETDKALEYLSSVSSYIDSTIPKQFCLNGVVNVILSHYANVAQLKGIKFICQVSLSRQLPLADIDLVAILSNAIENAVNALEVCDTKQIEIKGFESDGKFFFEVKNPFCGEIEFENDLPVSRRENHGYGTKSIAAIVEKHGGMYSFTVEDDIFVFRCAI